MSEASRRRSSRVTITLGRSGQVVSRDGIDLELEDELLPRVVVGNKRSVKERLGSQLDSDAVSKRQKGEASFSGNDLQISQSDLRFKLLQRDAQRRTQSDGGSAMDLREKLLSKSEHPPPPPRSLDSRPRMAEPRDGPLPPSRTLRAPSHMLSSSSYYSPRTLDDMGRRSPERHVCTSRGRSTPRNAASISDTARDLSPPRNTRSFSGGATAAVSPSRDARRINGYPRDLSPPRNTRSFSGGSRDARSPPRNAGRINGYPRDLSPLRHSGRRDLSPSRTAGRISGRPRDLSVSPPRNAGRMIGHPRDLSSPRTTGHPRDLSSPRTTGNPRDLSPPRHAGRISGHPRDLSPTLRDSGRITGHPRGLSPPRNAGRMITHPRDLSPPRNASNFSSGYRTMSPTRNVGSSYMSSSRGFSPPRNPPGSYMGSSMGSPPSRNMDDFTGRSRMLDDVRASPYGVRGVLNNQAPPANCTTFSRPMLPPPVPNPYPLPPLSQLPPFGSIMQNSPFPVEETLTVDSFLESLGLGRYSLAFKREEVDMTTIKQMKESDLKDLTIPMGPRKRILQAIACLPRL